MVRVICRQSFVKKKINWLVDLDPHNIGQKVEIIIEHFRNCIMRELGGKAKAMVVTSSREAAVRYKLAFERYIEEHNYNDIKALVAFSGKVTVDGNEYSEVGINKIQEKEWKFYDIWLVCKDKIDRSCCL